MQLYKREVFTYRKCFLYAIDMYRQAKWSQEDVQRFLHKIKALFKNEDAFKHDWNGDVGFGPDKDDPIEKESFVTPYETRLTKNIQTV